MDKFQQYQSPQPIGFTQQPATPYHVGGGRPGKATANAIMILIGGIWAVGMSIITWIYVVLATCGIGIIWPGPYYGLVMGIMAIVKGTKLLQDQQGSESAPTGIGIMQIVNIINCDTVNLILGIIVLAFCGSPECAAYYRRKVKYK